MSGKALHLEQSASRVSTTYHCAYDRQAIRIPRRMVGSDEHIKPEYYNTKLRNGVYIDQHGACYCSIDEWADLCFND